MGVLYLKGWSDGFELEELRRIYKILSEVIRQKKIDTVIWKNDIYAKDSYTRLIKYLKLEYPHIKYIFMCDKNTIDNITISNLKNVSVVQYDERYKKFCQYIHIKYNLKYTECVEFVAGITNGDRFNWKFVKEQKKLFPKLLILSSICTRVLSCGTREFR